MTRSSTYLGTVEDVQGATVSVLVDSSISIGLKFVDGYGYRVGQVGSFVRIPIGYVDLFGLISQSGASAAPEQEPKSYEIGYRWLTVQLVGEARGGDSLSRGVSELPTIGDSVHLVTQAEMELIYGSPDSDNYSYLSVGRIVGSDSIPCLVDVNKLLTRHTAIVGSTGSGKSTTVAGLLHRIACREALDNPRVLVFDIHGEYANALKSFASVFRINADTARDERELYIPFWALTFEELLHVSFGELYSETDRGALVEAITKAKQYTVQDGDYSGITPEGVTVDTPIPFSIHQLWLDLYRLVVATHLQTGNQSEDSVAYETNDDQNPVDTGDAMSVRPPKILPQDTSSGATPKVYLSQSPLNIRRQLEALAYKLRDSRYDFLFRPGEWLPNVDGATEEDLDSLLETWLGSQNGITVLDLSGVPAEVLDTLIGALLRIVYDALFWARDLPEGGRERPLLLVLEEAHSYVSKSRKKSASYAITRVAREGRKYGIGMLLVSQRPMEIDPTILSQCGTIIAMRLSNRQDHSCVSSVVSDNLSGLFDVLPILRTGEAVVVGEAVRIPARALIESPPAEFLPDSQDPLVYSPVLPGGWNQKGPTSDYAQVVRLWRRQDRKSESIISFDQEEDS